ncbi:MAG: aminoacyl-tRNA hydrolase, partial [Deltaproteobacteria bacterium]|nr:aminoacyl-tRNA hydrolase [Deltaproteobacteria bacterium]
MKQVIVIDASLKLPRGKLAAQAAHAAVAAFLNASSAAQRAWQREGMPKIVVKARDSDEMIQLEELARKKGIPLSLIADAGKTVVASGTLTALGLGPAEDAVLD